MKYLLLLLLIFLCINVNAQILISSVENSRYSLGDNLNINFTIISQQESISSVDVYLYCEDTSDLIYRHPVQLFAQKKYYFLFNWTTERIGDCKYQVRFAEDIKNSENFKISKDIELILNYNNKILFPEEELIIQGSALKYNQKPANGIINISIGNEINQTLNLISGNFTFKNKIPSKMKSGEHKVTLCAQTTENNLMTNRGCKTENISIKSVASTLQISANETIFPLENISIGIKLLNQEGISIKNESVILSLENTIGEKIFEKVIKTEQNITFLLPSNSSRGPWTIYSRYGKLYSNKQFYVLDKKHIGYGIINSQSGSKINLINDGNIPYIGVFEFSLEGNESIIKIPINLSLEIGENYVLDLGIDGQYNISSEYNLPQEIILYRSEITGSVIDSSSPSNNSGYIGAIVLTGIISMYYILRFRHKRKIFEGTVGI